VLVQTLGVSLFALDAADDASSKLHCIIKSIRLGCQVLMFTALVSLTLKMGLASAIRPTRLFSSQKLVELKVIETRYLGYEVMEPIIVIWLLSSMRGGLGFGELGDRI
jgi:hypothetical protein